MSLPVVHRFAEDTVIAHKQVRLVYPPMNLLYHFTIAGTPTAFVCDPVASLTLQYTVPSMVWMHTTALQQPWNRNGWIKSATTLCESLFPDVSPDEAPQ